MKGSRMLRIGLAMVAFGLAGVTATDAYAQNRSSRRRVVRIREVRIEGRIQKPQAFYILQRSNLNFEGLQLKNSFVPKIIKSVEKAPF